MNGSLVWLYKKTKMKFGMKRYIDKLRRKGVKIGKNFHVYSTIFDMNWPFLIEIGDDVTITNATLLTHDASMQPVLHKSKIGKIRIGNNVFIGYGSIVLSNVTIGDNVVIGAGSVVTRDIPSNSVAAGNPCRIIGEYTAFADKNRRAFESGKHAVTDAYRSEDPAVWEDTNKKLEDTWGYD